MFYRLRGSNSFYHEGEGGVKVVHRTTPSVYCLNDLQVFSTSCFCPIVNHPCNTDLTPIISHRDETVHRLIYFGNVNAKMSYISISSYIRQLAPFCIKPVRSQAPKVSFIFVDCCKIST